MKRSTIGKSSWPVMSTIYPFALIGLIAKPLIFSLFFILIFIFMVMEERKRPIILFLRKFGDLKTDYALKHFSAGTFFLGRNIWLSDLSLKFNNDSKYLNPNRGIQPFSTAILLIGLIIFSTWTLIDHPNSDGILKVLYIISSGIIWFLISFGMELFIAPVFYLSIAASYIVAPTLRVFGINYIDNSIFLILIRIIIPLIVFITFYKLIVRLFTRSSWFRRKFYFLLHRNTIKKDTDLNRLDKECSNKFALRPRYLINIPVGINNILCHGDYWKKSISKLLMSPKTAVAIIDVTHLNNNSGLEWEINECQYHNVPIFFICRLDKVKESERLINGIIPEPIALHSYQMNDHDSHLKNNSLIDDFVLFLQNNE